MACYHPLHAFPVGTIIETGKIKYFITSPDVTCINKPRKSLYHSDEDINLKECWSDVFITDYKEIPCGKCIGCRLNYSKQWAIRCMLESKAYKDNYFITLTYDDEHIPHGKTIDPDTGEVNGISDTLNPDDLTKFMKDLRRYYKYHFNIDNIRFFACGEYGDKNKRPHFHLILFNCPIPDLKEIFRNKENQPIYLSDTISKIWNKGIISVGAVTFNSAAYVSRYILKKQKGPTSNDYYLYNGLIPEFTRMSRKPGIGKWYYDEHKDEMYDTDTVLLKNFKGQVLRLKPGSYYDRLYDIDNPDLLKKIKKNREKCAKITKNNDLLAHPYDDEFDVASINEEAQLKKLCHLPRKMHNIID